MAFQQPVSSRPQFWREVIVCAAAAIFLTTGLSGVTQEANKPADETNSTASPEVDGAKKGDQIFQTRCLVCHNKQPDDTSPFGPPNLFQAFKTKSITTPEAEQIISRGKGQMPAFGTILSKTEVQSVIDYLKTGK
jgi:mono/diheme cytochrome c family protein